MNRILIISHHLMFGYGLESLLRQEMKLNVVGWETDIGRGIKTIEALQPEVIILDRDDALFDFASTLLTILNLKPGLKVICVNLQDNQLHIYQADHRLATSVEDLIAAIKEDQPSFNLREVTNPGRPEKIIAQFSDFSLENAGDGVEI
ncbi:MAG: hypothetical protein L0Y56_19185 [Nitrospira sp.]|nr:hypothetical protein [Nitrospira sp.]